MRVSSSLVALMCATQVAAQDSRIGPYDDVLDFYGGRGCTIHTRTFDEAALVAAGFEEDAAIGLTVDMVSWNFAERQGEYVVLSPLVCTIRLPEIETEYDLDDPRIRAIAPYVRDVWESDGETDVSEGGFLEDPQTLFTTLNDGDADEGFTDYVGFVAANIIAGDIRFHAPTPLATPRGFQIVTGDCTRAPEVPAIVESHRFVAEGFGRYVREVGALTSCDESMGSSEMALTASIQGLDPLYEGEVDPSFNAWLFMEYTMITLAAGWREGMSASERGVPRPPLCHYPPQ